MAKVFTYAEMNEKWYIVIIYTFGKLRLLNVTKNIALFLE